MKVNRKKVVLWTVISAALLFALLGGQYSTLDLLRQRSRTSELRSAIDSLQRQIDSLAAYRQALSTNARLQERIAREMWGWSREGEIVYKFVDEGKRP